MRIPNRQPLKSQYGLSLIELMVSLVIGLILTAAVLQTFIGSRVSYSMQTELAKLQENARFAMTFLNRDLQRAGYHGCKLYSYYGDNVSNILNDQNDDTTTDWFNPLSVTDATFPESDSFRVRFTDSSGGCTVDKDAPVAKKAGDQQYHFQCQVPHTFQKGNILVASDCEHLAIFQMTNDNAALTATTIEHVQDTVSLPGNCVGGLGENSDCVTPVVNEIYADWKPGTVVQRFANQAYSIGDSSFDSSVKALKRGNLDLVEGVENMQIELGVDTDSDSSANCYAADPATCGGTIDNVVALRVNLLMVSVADNLIDSRPNNEFSGTAFAGYSPTDKKLRKVFSSTITLRNRLIENDD